MNRGRTAEVFAEEHHGAFPREHCGCGIEDPISIVGEKAVLRVVRVTLEVRALSSGNGCRRSPSAGGAFGLPRTPRYWTGTWRYDASSSGARFECWKSPLARKYATTAPTSLDCAPNKSAFHPPPQNRMTPTPPVAVNDFADIRFQTILKDSGMTQVEIAKILGVQQPQVSTLMRHRAGNFSVGRLMEFLTALRQDVEITVRPTRKEHGTL